MTNGKELNGAPHTVTLNPQQAAAFALQFLPRVPHTQAEREAYDLACMFLQAIVSGQVVLAPAHQQAQPQLPGENVASPPTAQ